MFLSHQSSCKPAKSSSQDQLSRITNELQSLKKELNEALHLLDINREDLDHFKQRLLTGYSQHSLCKEDFNEILERMHMFNREMDDL